MTVCGLLRLCAAVLVAAAGSASAEPGKPGEAPAVEPPAPLHMAADPRLRGRTPQERRERWMRMTPAERAWLRQRWLQRRAGPREDMSAEQMIQGMPHRLTPEQRRQLREQIREAQREWRVKGLRGRHDQP